PVTQFLYPSLYQNPEAVGKGDLERGGDQGRCCSCSKGLPWWKNSNFHHPIHHFSLLCCICVAKTPFHWG
ncbi:hypothetical protein VIGAN_07116900, partial [Vigna angularis var. angularis]